MIVIHIDTRHQIEYITLINDLRLYNEDREIILRIKITDITTEVSEENENSERGYCLNWYIANKMNIKDH